MASFSDVAATVACACSIQQALAVFNLKSSEQLQVRIGIHAGEPVEDSNDLFGAVVQIAARICQNAAAESIVVSETVRELLADAFRLREIGWQKLKGLAAPVALYEVLWR